MCGRYVSPEEAEIERFWHIGRHNSNPFARHFNVSPTSIIPILRLDRSTGEIELVNARWGLIPPWWKESKPPRTTHNARSDGVTAIEHHPVSSRVNGAINDDEGLVQKVSE
jgi:putative SOS response-associated peptidase YedK